MLMMSEEEEEDAIDVGLIISKLLLEIDYSAFNWVTKKSY
jgi:hypothetical protein